MSIVRNFVVAVSICCCMAFAFTANAEQKVDPRSADGVACKKNRYNCNETPNPLPRVDTVWIEEMTWMDVRDAMAAGKKTIIIPTGGVEPNGPWTALGKHNYILQSTCDAIARKLGNALCAPVIKFVPEGDIETKSGHMDTVGTISVEQSTFEALVTDTVRSMKAHGFEHIVLISDNGGSVGPGLQSVADSLNTAWGSKTVLYIPEYYRSWGPVEDLLVAEGVQKPGVSDGVHDDATVAMIMMVTDPDTVRWKERVSAGLATIDGVSIADKEQTVAWGKRLIDYRATATVEAISQAIAQDAH